MTPAFQRNVLPQSSGQKMTDGVGNVNEGAVVELTAKHWEPVVLQKVVLNHWYGQ